MKKCDLCGTSSKDCKFVTLKNIDTCVCPFHYKEFCEQREIKQKQLENDPFGILKDEDMPLAFKFFYAIGAIFLLYILIVTTMPFINKLLVVK